MNKKIFTLLAGAFLMFAMVFSIKAQVAHGLWNENRLSLGDSVPTLNVGMNPGYYHLRVDSIVDSNGTYGFRTFPDSSYVLYMGKADAEGKSILFVDSLGGARSRWGNTNGLNDQFRSNSKAEESAASLWCVNISKYIQGQNLIFDFTNKQQNEMLQVDTYDYEIWGKAIDAGDRARHTRTNSVPGAVSGWSFSGPSASILYSKPLYSYITADTVAVLCLSRGGAASNRPDKDSVYIKIADVDDVLKGRVDGVIYFRLVNAAPFVVDPVDYNTYFGTKPTSQRGRLKFNQDVTDNYTNPFSKSDLMAEYLPLTNGEGGLRIVTSGWNPLAGGDTAVHPIDNYDTLRYSSNYLDSLGYIRFKDSNNNYIQVLREFFDGGNDGHQFLKIGTAAWETTPATAATEVMDSLFYGQKVFRLVYYPSGDSIYINPYQATYVPYGDEIKKRYNAYAFTDSASLAVFTYFADTLVLDTIGGHWTNSSGEVTKGMMTARLKYGNRVTNFYQPFLAHHRLYVALQDLTGSNRRLTLNRGAVSNHTINTQINFGLYNPCKEIEEPDEVTVSPDVYLIRNTAGQYLQVPLYSASDSAVWISLEVNEDPRYIPSFHWVVEKRYTNSTTSPVKITNREFDWLKFDNVQLYREVGPIKLRTKTYTWNLDRYKVNAANTTDWANKEKNSFSFIKLDKEFKNNPYLGYEYIHPDSAIVNAYALNFMSDINSSKYLGWKGDMSDYPKTDTTIYVNFESYFDKMYFSLDTIQEDVYGSVAEYGYPAKGTTISDLVTLKRQAYRLTYKDPFRYSCVYEFHMAPGEDAIYGITKKGLYKDILGKPVFYMRHQYKNADDVPYFTLVQRIDSTTTSLANTKDTVALRNYLVLTKGKQVAETVMGQIKLAGKVNPGLFVADYDEATGKLKMVLRADATKGNVTPFKLEKDVDPLYRRFNTVEEGIASDAPDSVHFYYVRNPKQFLFENTGLLKDQYNFWVNGKKNYLGVVLETEHPNLQSHSSTLIYVDTAYINRGTGPIKPQYMLAVRPRIIEDGMGCDEYGDPKIPLKGYTYADYLINAHDSAYATSTANEDYLWQKSWTRLVFTPAVHANDYLYILGGVNLENAPVWGKLANGQRMFDLAKLHAYAIDPANGIHAIYLGNNLHKDCVFSFRLYERRSNDFLLESETTNRDVENGPMIAPCEGGWLKYQNLVPVITASDVVDGMAQAMELNVIKAKEGEKPTGNDDLETNKVTVVGNAGGVTILNAAGKSVVINNILGQTVATTVLASDNEAISVAKGVVIVSIEGEETVKTLVK